MRAPGAQQLASASLRRAGRDALSLALIDARNHSLRWIAVLEQVLGEAGLRNAFATGIDPPLWTLGHIGWYQQRWIARNLQRARGAACDATQPPLAPANAADDRWFDPRLAPAERRGEVEPGLQAIREDLAATIEVTLDLLESAADCEAGLYFFRLVLTHESQCAERLAVAAQTLDRQVPGATDLLAAAASVPQRPPLLFPAEVFDLGSPPGAFALDNEQPPQRLHLPEFEIDAQPVSWAQFAEFVADGGYDEPQVWSADGWHWLQRTGRRVPRHVSQIRHGVLLRRFGEDLRVPHAQAAMHLSWFEADAWCRWAGRRLPTEAEWESAAERGASRGFRWGDVWEWTASTFRPYPGFTPGPDRELSEPYFGRCKVLRGASVATPARLRHPKLRGFAAADANAGFFGFRSCAA